MLRCDTSVRRGESSRKGSRLAFEPLEVRRVLDCGASAGFGYFDMREGFAFLITGSECQYEEGSLAEPDNIVISTNVSGSIATNFFVEYVTESGSWKTLLGSVSAGDISREANRRGLRSAEFLGIYIKSLGGDDVVRADGGGPFGIRSGAALGPFQPSPLLGQPLIVDGGSGDDELWGSLGSDMIRGGPGDDFLRGMAGDDSMMGSTGNDTLLGDDGDDYLRGDEGHDLIDGHAGNDTMRGGDGDDTLSGQAGDDALAGGSGDDDLRGDAGKDALSGDDGDDSLLGDDLDHNPSGGEGVDTWQAGDTTEAGIVIQNADIERINTTGSDPGEPTLENGNRFDRPGPFGEFGPFDFDDQVDSASWLATSLDGVNVTAGSGNDQLVGSEAGHDRLEAGSDNSIRSFPYDDGRINMEHER